ncbi:MAG: ferredoxin family protein [Promethearchaeota archaeon]
MKMQLEERLGLLNYNFDKEPHIIVKTEGCENCDPKPCMAGCPAGCFKMDNGKLIFNYEDCIECGTCKIVCPNDILEWNYPRGTFGVAFRYG